MNPGILTSGYRPPPMPYDLLGRPTPMLTIHGRTLNPDAYTLVFDTSRETINNQITLPFQTGSTVDVTIDWGDGTSVRRTTTGSQTKTYSQPGVYVVQISGVLNTAPGSVSSLTGVLNRPKLVQCLSFGNVGMTNLTYALRGHTNLTRAPSTLPTTITNMNNMFSSATSFNQPIGHWNTAAVTNMSSVFSLATSFNQPIGGWNTGSVTTMNSMFNGASSFSQPVHTWNISSVTTMSVMFTGNAWGRANYDAALIAWSQQNVQNNVTWGVGTNQYSAGAAAAARAVLVSKGWVITDGGQAP